MSCVSPYCPGEQYEAALRKQHKMMNPRTDWASRDNKAAKRIRATRASTYGGESEEEGGSLRHRRAGATAVPPR